MALIGAHISVAGGLHRAYQRADAAGCESMQIFTRNQRQWSNDPLSFREIEEFYRASKDSSVRKVVSHASYLINLGGNDHVRGKSEEALISELERCRHLSIDDVVLHPGFALESTGEAALARVSASLLKVLEATSDIKVRILLETMAGQGSVLGGDISEFSAILDHLEGHPRIGFCVDICHVFAAGYEIRTHESYNRLVGLLEKHVGLERIHCWHLSDSKMDKGSKKDRHQHLGEGTIGLEPFSMLVNDVRFDNVPAILETPKEGIGDEGNLSLLRKLRGE
ncbi:MULTISPECIES: deoxyribonuclease IV [Synergistaceae]|uniref:deoxyribonuclease IV n=1 Tax=Synergistaceae TaxID=649777 RepID=UPI003ADE6B46|nr:deoxyribonuclease IV [Synergistaceae bacterium DZ-S4]